MPNCPIMGGTEGKETLFYPNVSPLGLPGLPLGASRAFLSSACGTQGWCCAGGQHGTCVGGEARWW